MAKGLHGWVEQKPATAEEGLLSCQDYTLWPQVGGLQGPTLSQGGLEASGGTSESAAGGYRTAVLLESGPGGSLPLPPL